MVMCNIKDCESGVGKVNCLNRITKDELETAGVLLDMEINSAKYIFDNNLFKTDSDKVSCIEFIHKCESLLEKIINVLNKELNEYCPNRFSVEEVLLVNKLITLSINSIEYEAKTLKLNKSNLSGKELEFLSLSEQVTKDIYTLKSKVKHLLNLAKLN